MKSRHVSFVALLLSAVFAASVATCWAQSAGKPGDDEAGQQRPRGRGRDTVNDQGKGGSRARGGGHGPTEFHTDVPAHTVDLVLGRPTKNSITLSILAHEDIEGIVAYGADKGSYVSETPKHVFKNGQPVELAIGPLQPDTAYCYQFRWGAVGVSKYDHAEEGSFHTARPPGSTFTFDIQADSHLDENVLPERYRQSMLNVQADHPDFLVDLGDTSMTGKYRDDRAGAEKQYLAQRYYFGIGCQSAPAFLVLGNHDGESSRERRDERGDRGSNSPGVWANATRKKYFPNPVPDSFYTGNSGGHPSAGLLQDYYAWEWGDALFVVLDPYWFSAGEAHDSDENWNRSLGRDQYDWLIRTLETSKAPFKFVFIHHLVGGATPEGRGGAEASVYCEWGGKNMDGSPGFQLHRPGWPAPIHEVLVKNGVTIVFHGHDHIFAQQERDGITYQCVPQPGNRGNGVAPNKIGEYSYRSGKFFGSPGYMRITVAPDKVKAELVRSYQPADETGTQKNRQVDCTYEIGIAGKSSPAKPVGQ